PSSSPPSLHDALPICVIPLDGRSHVSRDIRQWKGDSRWHWEGDTLVVETTNFNGKNPLRGSSENMRVVERFTRADADTILYKFRSEEHTSELQSRFDL